MKLTYIKATEFCESVRDGTHDTPKQTESGYKLVTGKHVKMESSTPQKPIIFLKKTITKLTSEAL